MTDNSRLMKWWVQEHCFTHLREAAVDIPRADDEPITLDCDVIDINSKGSVILSIV